MHEWGSLDGQVSIAADSKGFTLLIGDDMEFEFDSTEMMSLLWTLTMAMGE